MKYLMPTQCKSCGAKIIFMKTNTEKYIPVDFSSVDNHKIIAVDIFDPKKHISHFATCPNAAKHRKLRVN